MSQCDEFFNTNTATADDDKRKEGDQRRHPTPHTEPQSLAPTKAHAQVPLENARTAPPSPPHPGILAEKSVPPGTEAAASTGRERDRFHGKGRRQPKASCDTGSLTSNTRNASAQAQACFTFHTPHVWGSTPGSVPATRSSPSPPPRHPSSVAGWHRAPVKAGTRRVHRSYTLFLRSQHPKAKRRCCKNARRRPSSNRSPPRSSSAPQPNTAGRAPHPEV